MADETNNMVRVIVGTVLAIILVVLLLMLLVPSWFGGEDDTDDGRDVGRGVTLGAVLDTPTDYVGDRVIVSGEVVTIRSARAFTIGGPAFGGELLVLTDADIQEAGGIDRALQPGDIVQVHGEVQEFRRDDAEQRTGATVAPNLPETFTGRPAVYADRLLVDLRGAFTTTPTPTSTVTPSPRVSPAF